MRLNCGKCSRYRSSLACVEILFVAISVDLTALAYSFQARRPPTDADCHSYCCNNFNAAIAASFNPRQSDDRVAPVH